MEKNHKLIAIMLLISCFLSHAMNNNATPIKCFILLNNPLCCFNCEDTTMSVIDLISKTTHNKYEPPKSKRLMINKDSDFSSLWPLNTYGKIYCADRQIFTEFFKNACNKLKYEGSIRPKIEYYPDKGYFILLFTQQIGEIKTAFEKITNIHTIEDITKKSENFIEKRDKEIPMFP